jgi:hypothetical protein
MISSGDDMPIGIVSDSSFEAELNKLNKDRKSDPARSGQISIIPSKGRKEGDVNVPESLRKIIGETHLTDGREEAIRLAAEFGISESSVSAYAKGATSTTSYNKPNTALLGHINKSRERAIKRASKTLNVALGSITQEKLDYADAKDLAGIAKDMSVIIKNLEPPVESNPSSVTNNGPQFVIYAPQFRKEESFDVISVNE